MPHLQPKIMGLYHKFIPDEAIEGFDRYKYSCKDTNPLSVYVMHPFWNRVVILCPRWVAPNVLTLVGFLCCVTHYLLPAIYDYDFSSPRAVPSAVWIAVGILLFLSHTLDGIDGKQARRTGTSSPLGELFDHGCDSWATVFTTSTLYAVFGNNADGLPPIRMYMLLWCIFTCFHVSHWEKYNTGVMYLPWNYDLSMVSGFTLYIVTGIVGVESLKVRVYGLRLATFFEVVTYCATFLVAIPVSLQNIYLSYRDETGKMRSFVEAVRPLVPLSSMAVICWSWIQLSPNDVLLADFRCICYLSGTIYSNICCRLIVTQMSDTRSEIFNIFLIPLAAGAAICILVPGLPRAGELAVLYILSLTLTLAHLHYSTCILIQLCDHLNIRCFTIDPKTMMTAMEGNVNIDDRERLLSIQDDLSDPVLAVTAGSAERHPLDN